MFSPLRRGLRHPVLLAAILAFSLVLLSACAPGTAGSREAVQAVPLRIGYLNVMDDAPVMLANDAELYQKNGLSADLKMFDSGTDMIKAIVGGQLDAGVLGFTNAVTWAAKGADLKIVGGAQVGYHSLLVRKDLGIKTVADLRGRRLASQQRGSTADIVLNGVVLPGAGLKREDVQVQYVSPSVAIQSLAAGQVDAAFVFEPYDHIARLTAPVTPIYEVGKAWPFPCMVVITSGKALEQNRDAINRMLLAQKEAIDMLREKPEDAARILAERFIPGGEVKTDNGSVPATDVVADAIRSQTFDWRISAEQQARMRDIVGMMVDQGILPNPVAVDQYLDLTWEGSVAR